MDDQKDQSFIDNIIQTVKDNGEYFVPIKGTKKSWDDYQQSKDPMDLIATIASGIGDVALIGGPVAGVFKGIGYGTRAANLASKAGKLGKVAKTWDESAKAAKSAGNIKKASRLQRGSAEAAHRSKLLTEDAQLARGSRNSHFRSLPLYGITYYDSRLPAQGSKRLKSMNKVKKVTPSNGDLVKKRTEPFLYNNFQKKDGGTVKKLISKHQYGNPIERQDNTSVKQGKKRDLTKEQYLYYINLINKAFPTTFEQIKQNLINRGILSGENDYSVPVGHLGDGYRSVTVSPDVNYGPYDLPQLIINGWGRTLDPEYSEDKWKDIARKTIQNDSTLSLSDASKYMWALNHPEFKLHPMLRSMATPIQPGPWDRVLYTSGEYEGYLPSDNPKYGGEGIISWDWDYPARSTTYKTTKYPPEEWNQKEHLYNWLDKFYNRKNGLNK